MTNWHNLESTVPTYGYAINRLVTVDEDGAGHAILLSLIDQRDDTVHNFVMDPRLASLLAWEMTGVTGEHIDGGFGDRLVPANEEWREWIAEQIAESLAGDDD
jgi:hypothetical protein